MRRRTLNPAAGGGIEWADAGGVEPAYAEAVAVELPTHTRVYLSGLTARDATLDAYGQTRDVLEQMAADLEELGGEVADVVRVRVYVASGALDEDSFVAIHRARGEFFERETYPASTLVEVAGLVRAGKLLEVDAEAVIPGDGEWTVETRERPVE